MSPLRTTLRALAVVPVAATVLLTGGTGPAQATTSAPDITAYRGGGSGGVTALKTYEAWTGTTVRRALDFTPDDSWSHLEGQSWQLNAWRTSGRQLTLSVPMFPRASAGVPSGSLAACARGDYDGHWSALGRNLVSYRLAGTVVRPGWEFNGDWFHWKASVSPAAFAGCFRHLVTTMRGVPGQAFSFDWNPNIGPGTFPAEQAWPGDGYVSTVGVDAYDVSWIGGTYPVSRTATAAQRLAAEQKTWDYMLRGDHGLLFWSAFAKAHGLRMTLPEWGLSVRADGHGGGDNPYYVQQMLQFIKDPSSGIAWASYFDYDSGDGLHQVSGGATTFPNAKAAYLAAVRAWLVPTPVAVLAPVVTSSTLLTSTSSARTAPVALQGATVKGSLYAFVKGDAHTRRVTFHVDDTTAGRAPVTTEHEAPWDLGGGTSAGARPYGLARLAVGTHTLTVVLTDDTGAQHRSTSSFRVTA